MDGEGFREMGVRSFHVSEGHLKWFFSSELVLQFASGLNSREKKSIFKMEPEAAELNPFHTITGLPT